MAKGDRGRRLNRPPKHSYSGPPVQPKYLFQGLTDAIERAYGRVDGGRFIASVLYVAAEMERRARSMYRGPHAPQVECVMVGFGSVGEPKRRSSKEGLSEAVRYSRRQVIRAVQFLCDEGWIGVRQELEKAAQRLSSQFGSGPYGPGRPAPAHWQQRKGGCDEEGVGNANEYVPGSTYKEAVRDQEPAEQGATSRPTAGLSADEPRLPAQPPRNGRLSRVGGLL